MKPSLTFARGKGTVEFKVSAYELYDGDDNVLMVNAGPIGVRLFRDGNTLTFVRVEPPDGQRSCSVDISGLDRFDRFRVFLVWSPEKLNLHIGPHPPVDGVELRSAADQ